MKQQKLYEQVEEVLANEIAEGIYKPGDPLPTERDLMERFDVGRPSIREALFSLSKRGLVSVRGGRRPRVLQPSFDIILHELDLIVRQILNVQSNIFQLMELRRILECALARRLAKIATDEQIEELRAKLDENRSALGNLDRFWKTDSEFHSTIARMNNNPILPTIIDTILNWLIQNRRVTLSASGSDRSAYEHHEAIFDAIASRDPDFAEKQMERHLLIVESRVTRQLEDHAAQSR